jgi:predicted secreted hydrolase
MRPWLLLPCLLLPGPEATVDGFRIAQPGHTFHFPADHGSHPDFHSEWWYYTGLLKDPAGRTYGFQLTFFREAASPAAWKGSEHWRSDQLYLAHAALTDVAGRRFSFDERLNRGGLLAGATEGRLQVFNGAWTAQDDGRMHHLRFQVEGRSLALDLRPLSPPVIFGEAGVSRKGDDPASASHYVSFPRLAASGELREGGQGTALAGEAWMDHEWSSNQLGSGQVGWDWAGLRLKDGRSLMAYRIRRADGSADPWSTLTEIDVQGRVARSTRTWELASRGQWKSPRSGTAYPTSLVIRAWGEAWVLEPLLADQELRTRRSNGISYWEGACRVRDAAGAEVGEGYLELTGYAGSLKGRF